MNIREMFGYDIVELNNTEKSLDNLLNVFLQAVYYYYDLDEINKLGELIQKAKTNCKSSGDKLFFDWLTEEGFPLIKNILSSDLLDNDQLISQINYEKYYLEKEIGYHDKDELKYSLIDVIEDLPERINSINNLSENELSSTIEYSEGYDLKELLIAEQDSNFEKILLENMYQGNYLTKKIIPSLELKEEMYRTPNKKELADYADSFFYF